MKNYLWLILPVVLLFTACRDKDNTGQPTDFTITFKARYDGEHLIRNKYYPYDNYKVLFSRFNSFFSDIKLLKSDGTEQLLTDAAMVNFTPDISSTDSSAIVKLTFSVPSGDYSGLKMGYGVKPSDNAKKPQDFPVGHPFNNELEYWAGWKSYIFNKIEGTGDSDNNNEDDIFLIYHCGSDAVYREYAFNKDIKVSDNNSGITVAFDLKKLFYVDNQWFDLKIDDNQFTSNKATDVRVATILMDNYDHATSVE